MKKTVFCLLMALTFTASAATKMRVCEPTQAAAPVADGLRDVGGSPNYSALCSKSNFHCKDVAKTNMDQPDAHCFVITAKRGQIPQPQDIGQAAGLGGGHSALASDPDEARRPQIGPAR